MLDFLARLFPQRLRPVSKALTIETGLVSTKIAAAIAAIDRVHTDGALPSIPVKQAVLLDMYGYFLVTGGKAAEVAVSVINPHIELTTVHEIGHFLDLNGLDSAAGYASVNSPKLTAWRQAVKTSQAVQNLRQHMSPSLSSSDRKYVDYLLTAEELWARSYSQFISIKSGDATLRQQLDTERNRPGSGIYYEKLWSDVDFQPIMLEIESVFRQLGWM